MLSLVFDSNITDFSSQIKRVSQKALFLRYFFVLQKELSAELDNN